MDALTRAFNDGERSYQTSKASQGALRDELFAQGPAGLIQRPNFALAGEAMQHYRGWVYACIRAIGQKIAGQQFNVGHDIKPKRMRKGAINAEALDSHPLLDLLCNPNDLMTGWALKFSTIASLELTGRSLWWFCKDREGATVWPIPTSWIVDVVGRRQTFMVRPPRTAAEPIPIPADEACYFSYPHPNDPHGSMSPLQAAGLAVHADEEIQASQVAAFHNGINPKHALMVGGMPDHNGNEMPPHALTSAQKKQLIRAVRAIYSRTCSHGEPLILDGMIKDIKSLSRTIEEMDFQASGKITKERICEIFGVNPIILGHIEGANRASALAAEEHFAEYCLNPKIQLISETLTTTLGPRYPDSRKLMVWLNDVVPADKESDLEAWSLLAKTSAVTVNEIRAWYGLPEVEWGDVPVGLAESLDDQIAQLVSGT